MPQIQYSEKYYDDIYEYRYVRIRVRRFPARLDALFVSLHATNGVRARSRGFPRLEGTRDGHDGDAPRDIGVARGARYARYARSSACVSIGTRRDVFAGAFPARASLGIAERARRVPLRNRVAAHLASPSTAIDRHVVLPPDIAKLLPKGRLLSEVRFRTAMRLDADATPERRRYRSSVSRPHRCRSGPDPFPSRSRGSFALSSPRARVRLGRLEHHLRDALLHDQVSFLGCDCAVGVRAVHVWIRVVGILRAARQLSDVRETPCLRV